MGGVDVLQRTTRFVVEWEHDEEPPAAEGPEPDLSEFELVEVVRARVAAARGADHAIADAADEADRDAMIGEPLF